MKPERTGSVLQDGADDEPVKPEEYQQVRDGKGTDEQISRVKAALRDPTSALSEWLGEKRTGALMYITWRFRTREEHQRLVDAITPIAKKNFDRLFDYIIQKRDAGILTQDEVHTVIRSMDVPHLDIATVDLSPAEWAMCVSRVSKAVIKLHPELEAEVRAIPISRKR